MSSQLYFSPCKKYILKPLEQSRLCCYLLQDAQPDADVHGDDVHGVSWTLGQISQAGHQLGVVINDRVLYVEIENL